MVFWVAGLTPHTRATSFTILATTKIGGVIVLVLMVFITHNRGKILFTQWEQRDLEACRPLFQPIKSPLESLKLFASDELSLLSHRGACSLIQGKPTRVRSLPNMNSR